MWLNITQWCFPMWRRLSEDNILFEGQFKITGQTGSSTSCGQSKWLKLGWNSWRSICSNHSDVTGQTVFPLQLQVLHSWNHSCFSGQSQPSYTLGFSFNEPQRDLKLQTLLFWAPSLGVVASSSLLTKKQANFTLAFQITGLKIY